MDAATVLERLAAADRILVQQVFKPIGNEYRIGIPPEGRTDEGEPLLFVKQKKLSVREDIRFRLAPDAEAHLFRIQSRTVFEFSGRHAVLDDGDREIGALQKSFGRSLLRSHWQVFDAAGAEVLEAHEASWVVALIRRFIDLVPFVGDILFGLQWLPFDFVLRRDGHEIGRYKRVLGTFRDRYLLTVDDEGSAGIDRRLLVAFTVALDALQDR
jgi:uncharacterized protein YxjI